MDSIEREILEEQIRTLSRQCKCFSREGPCRFCLKAEKINNKLDQMQAEDDLVRNIAKWIRELGPKHGCSCGNRIAEAIENGEWRPK